MRAWTHGITREQVLDALGPHRTAERLTGGRYWNGNHGCAVGCTLANFDNDAAAEGDHARYETLFGIARDVALLEDTLFELLPPAENRLWPERFVRAIAPGADVGEIMTRWIIWLLNDEASPVHKHVRASAKQITALYERRLRGDEPTPDDWRTTRLRALAALDGQHGHQRDRVAVREGRVGPLGRRHQDAVPRECTECGATLLGTGPPADLRRGAGRPVTSPLRWRLRSSRCWRTRGAQSPISPARRRGPASGDDRADRSTPAASGHSCRRQDGDPAWASCGGFHGTSHSRPDRP